MTAIAALALVAMSAVAVAQSDGIVTGQTMDVEVAPTDAGTKKKPKSATTTVQIVTDPDHEPTVDVFTYQFPKTLKVSTAGFKYCTLQFLSEQQSDAKCKRGSKIGSGTASARIGSRNSGPLNFAVAIYASKGGMTLWLEDTSGLDIRRAIPIEIQDSSDPDFNQELVADIPEDVEYTAGVKVVLEQVTVKIGATRKKVIKRNGKKRIKRYYVVSSRGCPANGQQTIGTELSYKEPPGQAPTKAQGNDNCTK